MNPPNLSDIKLTNSSNITFFTPKFRRFTSASPKIAPPSEWTYIISKAGDISINPNSVYIYETEEVKFENKSK